MSKVNPIVPIGISTAITGTIVNALLPGVIVITIATMAILYPLQFLVNGIMLAAFLALKVVVQCKKKQILKKSGQQQYQDGVKATNALIRTFALGLIPIIGVPLQYASLTYYHHFKK